MYTIGNPQNPKPTDECYDDYETAEIAAIQASIDDGVWCVREAATDEILSLIYQQQAFTA